MTTSSKKRIILSESYSEDNTIKESDFKNLDDDVEHVCMLVLYKFI